MNQQRLKKLIFGQVFLAKVKLLIWRTTPPPLPWQTKSAKWHLMGDFAVSRNIAFPFENTVDTVAFLLFETPRMIFCQLDILRWGFFPQSLIPRNHKDSLTGQGHFFFEEEIWNLQNLLNLYFIIPECR